MMKKCLSLLLVLAMLLSVCPMGVFADEETPSDPGTEDTETTGSTLELVAIYDQGGHRLIASGIDSAEVGEDVVPEGKGVIRTFLLDAETLIPYSFTEDDYTFEQTTPDETADLDAAEPTEETEAVEPTEEPTEATEAPEETEATEETVATEETEAPAEVPEEELTVDEAAQDGYYVAPEGAQLEETATVEEMAAFSGNTVNKGEQSRTTTFSGLMPGELYFFAVSKATGAPDSMEDVVAPENLVYADAKEALSDGTVSFENYQLTTGEAVIVQLYGYPNVKSIRFKGLDENEEVDEDGNTIQNLTLKVGETYGLGVLVEPAQWGSNVVWTATDPTVTILDTTGDGDTQNQITAGVPGVSYVRATVTHGAYTMTATCRVKVVNLETTKVTDVELKDNSVTTELYRTEGTLISIFPEFSQRTGDISTQAAFNAEEDNVDGHLIKSAAFGTSLKEGDKNYDKELAAADRMNELFQLEVVDDWTLRLIPTDYAVENPSEVATRYSSKIVLEVEDGTDDSGNVVYDDIVTDKALTVNVKKSTPKLTADSIQINSFYDDKSYEINVNGATVTGISEVDGKPLPQWLNLSDNELSPAVNDRSSRSATVYLSVETEEWAVPAEVKLGVKVSYDAPALRLSQKSVTLASTGSEGTTIQLLSQDKTKKLENMFIEDVYVSSMLELDGEFDPKNGDLNLIPAGTSLWNGTVNIVVSFTDASTKLYLPLQVKAVKPTLQLSASSVTMNTAYGDVAKISLKMSPSDAPLPDDLEWVLTDSKNKALDVEPFGIDDKSLDEGLLTIATYSDTAYASAYRLHVRYNFVYDDQDNVKSYSEAVLNIKTLNRSTKPTVTLRASGTLDLAYPTKGITLTRNFRNVVSPEEEYVLKVNGKTVNFKDYFHQGQSDENLTDYFSKEDPKCFYLNKGVTLSRGTKLSIQVRGWMNGEKICESKAASLTVKRTDVMVKLNKTSLTLNAVLGDEIDLPYTYNLKGDIRKDPLPSYSVLDSKNAPSDALDVTIDSKKITVATNDDSVPGSIYKVYVRANSTDAATILTVKIATVGNASKVTYTTTVSGTIDPTRDTSKVTVKYTVRNFVDTDPDVKITDTTIGEDVSYKFDIVKNEKNASQFFVTKKPAEVLDTSHKYQVVADYKGRDAANDDYITAKSAVLKVAAAKSNVKADRTVTIYKKDPNATYKFAVTSTDKKLNNVEALTIKDSKLQGVYEIVSLGNGTFEIYVKANSLEKVKAGNLTLNYYVRGMVHEDARGNDLPNGTLTLKIAVK